MPGVAEEAASVLQERCPGLNVLGTQHGYFLPEEEDGIVGTIAGLRPDVLFVGLGLPRQEKWITRNLGRLGVPVCIGVGGSFDIISGRLRRAPAWMQRCGLEWLYRAVREPKRLPRLLGLPRFLIMTARSLRARERSDKT
jgi:N-acetylglucosaminyldiphosphoundecaprenol N-acetyl-beta-D-mannosaminyltransferase